jgi:hypothetical protein
VLKVTNKAVTALKPPPSRKKECQGMLESASGKMLFLANLERSASASTFAMVLKPATQS